MAQTFIYSDGGRSKYFKAENVGDCVTRAICNATGKDYKEVYDSLNQIAKSERKGKRKRGKSTSRNGVYKGTIQKYIEDTLGWKWVSTMQIGSGCQKHLNADEFDDGTYIIEVSKHITCMKNGTIYDTYDPSRDGTRCVYGYWCKPKDHIEPKLSDYLDSLYYREVVIDGEKIDRLKAYNVLKDYLVSKGEKRW